MYKITLSLIAAAAAATAMATMPAAAAPVGHSDAVGAAVGSISPLQTVQYRWSGREYCWYDTGWHGPGFYWCGYALRTGLGWGGGIGWHGWKHSRGNRSSMGTMSTGRSSKFSNKSLTTPGTTGANMHSNMGRSATSGAGTHSMGPSGGGGKMGGGGMGGGGGKH